MLTVATSSRYAPRAGAKSPATTDLGRSQRYRRISAHRDNGAFFAPIIRVCGGCMWDAFERAGTLYLRSANPHAVASNCLAAVVATPKIQESYQMASLRLSNLITRSLSSRAAAHRAMAKAALFADSSTRTRLKRYNHHIEKAQQLETRALEAAKRSVGAVS